jgi:hypothetical protein
LYGEVFQISSTNINMELCESFGPVATTSLRI